MQGELKKKEISIPTKVPPSLPQPSPIQRAAMNRRHQYSRSTSGSISLLQSSPSSICFSHTSSTQSPGNQTTSPTSTRSTTYANTMRPPSGGFKALPPPLRVNPVPPMSSSSTMAPLQAVASSPLSQPSSAGVAASTQWPSIFETHMQQLGKPWNSVSVCDRYANHVDYRTGI